MAITYNSFGTLQANEDFRAPLAWVNTMIPRFEPLAPSFTKNKAGKQVYEFFQNTQILPNVFQYFILKNLYYTTFLQIQSHM